MTIAHTGPLIDEKDKRYLQRIAELEALLGKWISHDGHVCPSCGCPTGLQETISKLEAELAAMRGRHDTNLRHLVECQTENERLKKQYSDVCDDIEMQNKQMDKIQAFGVRRGMERAAEIAWKLHCSGPPNSIHTAYDASNAIRAELEKSDDSTT